MKRQIAALALVLLSGCHLQQPLTQAQVLGFILDARYGVDVGCYAEWLNPPTCLLAYRVLDDANAAALNAPNGWQAAAKAVLVREESLLPADSKIRPYLDALIPLL